LVFGALQHPGEDMGDELVETKQPVVCVVVAGSTQLQCPANDAQQEDSAGFVGRRLVINVQYGHCCGRNRRLGRVRMRVGALS
jgi:hypothetical protein